MKTKRILLLISYTAAILFAVFFGLFTAGFKGYMPHLVTVATGIGIIMQFVFRLYYLIKPKGRFKHIFLIASDVIVFTALLYELFDMYLTDTRETLIASVSNVGLVFMEVSIVAVVVYWRSVFKGQIMRKGHEE